MVVRHHSYIPRQAALISTAWETLGEMGPCAAELVVIEACAAQPWVLSILGAMLEEVGSSTHVNHSCPADSTCIACATTMGRVPALLSSLDTLLPSAQLPPALKWKPAAIRWLDLPTQRLCFAGVVHKVNRHNWKQKRVLLVTRTVVASCHMDNGKVTRAFPIDQIAGVWVQEGAEGHTQIVMRVPSQYDLVFACDEETAAEIVSVMNRVTPIVTGKDADICNVLAPKKIGEEEFVLQTSKPKGWSKTSHLQYIHPTNVSSDLLDIAAAGGPSPASSAGVERTLSPMNSFELSSCLTLSNINEWAGQSVLSVDE